MCSRKELIGWGWGRWLRLEAVLLVVVLAVPAGADEMADGTPGQLIGAETTALLTLLRDGTDRYETDRAAFLADVSGRLARFLDFDGIARLVMGASWKSATADQRSRFAGAFRSTLVDTYTRGLLAFGDITVTVDGVRPGRSEKRATVLTRVRSSAGKDIPMTYSMVRMDSGWRVRNVIIDGVNLGLIFRNQFANAVAKGSAGGDLDSVISNWSATVDSVNVGDRGPATAGASDQS